MERGVSLLHCILEGTEAQRSHVNFPTSHRDVVAEEDLKPCPPAQNSCFFVQMVMLVSLHGSCQVTQYGSMGDPVYITQYECH